MRLQIIAAALALAVATPSLAVNIDHRDSHDEHAGVCHKAPEPKPSPSVKPTTAPSPAPSPSPKPTAIPAPSPIPSPAATPNQAGGLGENHDVADPAKFYTDGGRLCRWIVENIWTPVPLYCGTDAR